MFQSIEADIINSCWVTRLDKVAADTEAHRPQSNKSDTFHNQILTSTFLVPDHIPRPMTSHEEIQITIAIHVFRSKIVGTLIHAHEMFGEIPLTIIFIPKHVARLKTAASGTVEIAVAIEILENEAVRANVLRVYLDGLEIWPFEPHQAYPMAS